MNPLGKKWTPEEKEQIFNKALEVLRSDYVGTMLTLWQQAQMVLPADRRYDEFSNSYPTMLTKQFKEWRKAQPGPHPELDKLPHPKKAETPKKKLLTPKQRSRIARKANRARWAKKRQEQSNPVIAGPSLLGFCPKCGTDRNLCAKCGLDFRTVKFVAP
jgi:hypothetical protein